jgi:hypothetical protein
MKQLEKVVEEIRKLMLRLEEEVVSKEKLDRGKPTQATGKMKKQQQNRNKGAKGQLWEKFWDL